VTLTCVLIFFSENKKKPVDVSGLMFLLKVWVLLRKWKNNAGLNTTSSLEIDPERRYWTLLLLTKPPSRLWKLDLRQCKSDFARGLAKSNQRTGDVVEMFY
jgi:hypothetical protein